MIGRIVFGREHAVLVTLGFEEAVHRLDKGFALVTQFSDVHLFFLH